jgi:hypothetical protein
MLFASATERAISVTAKGKGKVILHAEKASDRKSFRESEDIDRLETVKDKIPTRCVRFSRMATSWPHQRRVSTFPAHPSRRLCRRT